MFFLNLRRPLASIAQPKTLCVLSWHLDELFGGGPLLECAAELVRGKGQVGVLGDDELFDRLNAGSVALLQREDGLMGHLASQVQRGQRSGKQKTEEGRQGGIHGYAGRLPLHARDVCHMKTWRGIDRKTFGDMEPRTWL